MDMGRQSRPWCQAGVFGSSPSTLPPQDLWHAALLRVQDGFGQHLYDFLSVKGTKKGMIADKKRFLFWYAG